MASLNEEKAKRILSESLDEHIQNVEVHDLGPGSHDVYSLSYISETGPGRLIFKSVPEEKEKGRVYNLRKEVGVIKAVRKNTEIITPEIVNVDLSEEVIDAGYFLMHPVTGTPLTHHVENGDEKRKRWCINIAGKALAQTHTVPLEEVNFLSEEEFLDDLFGKISRLQYALREDVTRGESERIEKSLKTLIENAPSVLEYALLNGDPETSHILVDNDSISMIDWDPATIGDRAWDISWMVGGGISHRVFQTDRQLERLTERYEHHTGLELENKDYFRLAAVTLRYALGYNIFLHGDPDHVATEFFMDYKPKMEETLDQELLKY